jgi:hypothetical protein
MSLLNEVAMSPVTVSEGEPSTHPWLGVPTHMCELASRASSFTCSTHEKVGGSAGDGVRGPPREQEHSLLMCEGLSLSIKPNPFCVSQRAFYTLPCPPIASPGWPRKWCSMSQHGWSHVANLTSCEAHRRITQMLILSLSHVHQGLSLEPEKAAALPGLTRGSAPRVAPPRTRQTTTSVLVDPPARRISALHRTSPPPHMGATAQ